MLKSLLGAHFVYGVIHCINQTGTLAGVTKFAANHHRMRRIHITILSLHTRKKRKFICGELGRTDTRTYKLVGGWVRDMVNAPVILITLGAHILGSSKRSLVRMPHKDNTQINAYQVNRYITAFVSVVETRAQMSYYAYTYCPVSYVFVGNASNEMSL